jgi:uncharacterized protein
MICIYHSRDLDGWMSGAIVKLKYPDVKLIGWDYGQPLPVLPDEKIIMVDISFPMELMSDISENLTWIDHHISAINDYNHFMVDYHNILCERNLDPKFAACELTWQYFFSNISMPELVRLLGRYDCFGHKGTEEELKVLEFQYGARQAMSNVDEAYQTLIIARGRGDWSFDSDLCDDIHLQGKAIYKYLCAEAKQIYNRKFDICLDTRGHEDRDWTESDKRYKFACVNQERFNPINFGIDYHKDGYDGFACFHLQNNQFMYSLYNDNGLVDCSVIAKGMGGGGHKGASGFRSNKILF